MAVRNREIGWSPMANALYDVLREFNALKGQFANTTTTTTTTGLPIGPLTWMTKNLDSVTYQNGDPIYQVADISEFLTLTTGAYGYVNNDPSTVAEYGLLYNWYAINDPRNIAPIGFHVASSYEWGQLIQVVDPSYVPGTPFAPSSYGGDLKETGLAHWDSPNTNATNTVGFSAIGAGFLGGYVPGVNLFRQAGHYWTADVWPDDNNYAIYFYFYSSDGNTGSNVQGLNNACAVRCVKN